jgi:hypothetical protein
MTVNDARKIIAVMLVSYPNFKPIDTELMSTTWADMLNEYSYEQVSVALKCYITTDTSGFAPSIGQLIDKLKTVEQPQELNELQAWGLVRKAINNSGYHSEEEFAKLPPLVQKAVGTPGQLKQWGMLDIESIETVAQSNFMRTYRAVAKREDEVSRMPKEIRQLIQQNEPKIMIEYTSVKAIEDKNREWKPMSDEIQAKLDKLKELE